LLTPAGPISKALNEIVRLAEELARQPPRSLDIAIVRYQAHQLAAELATGAWLEPPPASPRRRGRRRRVVAPGYWAQRKRLQRARIKLSSSSEDQHP
jgi:hypothetical protein